MSVQIHINGENASEAIRELYEIASHFGAPKAAESVKVEKNSRTTKVNAPAADPVKQEEPVQQESRSVEDMEYDLVNGLREAILADQKDGDKEQHIPTDVELRAKASEKGNTAGKQKVKDLLVEYGVPNITGVPAEKRIAFMKDLEAL